MPPLVVHGFRNASDVEVRYLNFHAPGQRFVDYLRAMRDGSAFSYDQHEPPADGGRPSSEAVGGGAEVLADGVSLLADVEELGMAEARLETGATSPPTHLHRRHVESFYVLEGELTFTAGGHSLQATAGLRAGASGCGAYLRRCRRRAAPVPEPALAAAASATSCAHSTRPETRTMATARAAFDQEPVCAILEA